MSNTFNYGHILSVSLQALLEVAGMRHLNFNIITYQSREEIISLILAEQSTQDKKNYSNDKMKNECSKPAFRELHVCKLHTIFL